MNTKTGTRKRYSAEQIKSMISLFEKSPKIEKTKSITASEALKSMSKEIFALQDRGYTLQMILEILHKNGFDVSLATLKSAIGSRKRRTKVKNETEIKPLEVDDKDKKIQELQKQITEIESAIQQLSKN